MGTLGMSAECGIGERYLLPTLFVGMPRPDALRRAWTLTAVTHATRTIGNL
jgi:hypothetical protein